MSSDVADAAMPRGKKEKVESFAQGPFELSEWEFTYLTLGTYTYVGGRRYIGSI